MALQVRTDGFAPTLTCRSNLLWIESMAAPHYQRFMKPIERARLQGFPDRIKEAFEGDDRGMEKAMGNAISMPVLGLVAAAAWSGFIGRRQA
jgi:site-specific DNA-cytosine methylase